MFVPLLEKKRTKRAGKLLEVKKKHKNIINNCRETVLKIAIVKKGLCRKTCGKSLRTLNS